MILPTKHLNFKRSLLGIGRDILVVLDRPMTVSCLWDEFKKVRGKSDSNRIPFDYFILSLDLLYIMGAVEYERGRIKRQGLAE